MNKFYIVGVMVLVGVAAWLLDPTGRMACAFIALVAAMAMTHVAIRDLLTISYKQKIFDMPDMRRVHTIPVPRLGGAAFTPIIICATIAATVLCISFTNEGLPLFRYVILIVPMAVLWMVGVMDDLVGVRWSVKFVVQILIGLMVVYAGLRIDDLHGFLGIHALPGAVAVPLTVLFIVAAVNALNLIDGIDGLAAGLCILMSGLYGARMFATGEYLLSFMAFASLGVLIPFFYINVRGYGPRRRRMFMGDGGSLTMGLIMSILATGLMTNAPETSSAGGGILDFTFAFSPLLVPLFDVVHVSVFRVRRGASPFLPDKTHIHHRLMDKGFSRRTTVTLILALTALFTAVNCLLAPHVNLTWVLALDAAIWLAFNSPVLHAKGAGKRNSVPAGAARRHTETKAIFHQ